MPAGTSYLFKENMLGKRLLPVEGTDTPQYRFTVRNHFLHAVHPVGWIKTLDVEIDGKLCGDRDVWFIVRGQWFSASKLETISEVFWNLCEQAEICFSTDVSLAVGKHHVKCTFSTSLLEDTQVLDVKNVYSLRVEFVDGELEL
ncbi:MAG: DUF6379 domain-containing protein [Oscillospiraceae bacterium]